MDPKDKKVLIVDDEKLLGDALEIKFKYAGFQVLRAENGQEGLEVCQQNHPDVIILDLLMPVMDGKAMLKALRDIPDFKELPVIILTNSGDINSIRDTQGNLGAIDFLEKSNVKAEELLDKVKKVLF